MLEEKKKMGATPLSPTRTSILLSYIRSGYLLHFHLKQCRVSNNNTGYHTSFLCTLMRNSRLEKFNEEKKEHKYNAALNENILLESISKMLLFPPHYLVCQI